MIIGTAGHIDHGKTSLVKALTNIDTDRLKEEKKRGMSIDIGFAHINLPSGATTGLIDVPGHENFIRNMLAGIQGVDLVLLVVAADDGVMPQTREHVDIVDLLGIKEGIVVITKKDLADEARLEEVMCEISGLLEGRKMQGAPIVPFSAKTGEGLEEIKTILDRAASKTPKTCPEKPFRMPVDRCFTIKGLGTVVTGTVISGSVSEGESTRLFPGGRDLRIRRIESYGEESKGLHAGMRGALNLPGIEAHEINRGHILASTEYKRETRWIDALIEPALFNKKPIKSGERVHLHIGTANLIATFYPLRAKSLQPGKKGYASLKLAHPAQIVRGERFIIRDYSAQRTLAGGKVLNPFRPRLKRKGLADYFHAWDCDDEAKLLEHILANSGGVAGLEQLSEHLNMRQEEVLSKTGPASPFRLCGKSLILERHLENTKKNLLDELERYHLERPSGTGMEVESLRGKTSANIPAELFRDIIASLEREGAIEKRDEKVRLKGKEAKLSPKESIARKKILSLLNEKGYQTASEAFLTEHDRALKKTLASMAIEGLVVQVSKENFIDSAHLEKARELLFAHFKDHDSISVIQYKNILETGRKGAIIILEYFDKTHLTLRRGDDRIMMQKRG